MSTMIDKRGIDSTTAIRLGDNHLRSMALAGTVAVPSPFPAAGPDRCEHATALPKTRSTVWRTPRRSRPSSFRKVLVEIAHEVNPRLTITRVVKLCDIAAVFQPADTSQVSLSQGQWYLSPELEGVVL